MENRTRFFSGSAVIGYAAYFLASTALGGSDHPIHETIRGGMVIHDYQRIQQVGKEIVDGSEGSDIARKLAWIDERAAEITDHLVKELPSDRLDEFRSGTSAMQALVSREIQDGQWSLETLDAYADATIDLDVSIGDAYAVNWKTLKDFGYDQSTADNMISLSLVNVYAATYGIAASDYGDMITAGHSEIDSIDDFSRNAHPDISDKLMAVGLASWGNKFESVMKASRLDEEAYEVDSARYEAGQNDDVITSVTEAHSTSSFMEVHEPYEGMDPAEIVKMWKRISADDQPAEQGAYQFSAPEYVVNPFAENLQDEPTPDEGGTENDI